jgi:hypothetical protein
MLPVGSLKKPHMEQEKAEEQGNRGEKSRSIPLLRTSAISTSKFQLDG